MIVLLNLGLGQLFVINVVCSVAAGPAVVYVGLCAWGSLCCAGVSWLCALVCVEVICGCDAGDLPLNLPSIGGGRGGRVCPLHRVSWSPLRKDGSVLCSWCE
jgi:hypothetical protein